jgi:hypothetical protein
LEFVETIKVGLVSVYSCEKDWDTGNKIKTKTIPKINFFIRGYREKPFIKDLVQKDNDSKPSLH